MLLVVSELFANAVQHAGGVSEFRGLVFARALGNVVRERVVVHPDAGFRQVRCGGDAAQLPPIFWVSDAGGGALHLA